MPTWRASVPEGTVTQTWPSLVNPSVLETSRTGASEMMRYGNVGNFGFPLQRGSRELVITRHKLNE